MKADKTRIIKTSALALLVLLVLTPPLYRVVFESAPFRLADRAGAEYVDAAFDRALVAFALARATNAIISVIQDSEIDIAPAGVGVTIAIGEALDPVNDMVERFSWVMLVSLVSLGIQKLLIDISPWVSIKFILLPALVLLLAGLWLRRDRGGHMLAYFGRQLVFVAILVRFCVPAVSWVNDQVYELFLDQPYSVAVAGIEQGNDALRRLDPLAGPSDGAERGGFWGEMRKRAEKMVEIVDLQNRIDRMTARVSGMIENLLQMIVVFLLNTVILPLGFLWLLLRLFRLMTGGESIRRLEQGLLARMAGHVPAEPGSETVHPGRNADDAEVDEKGEHVKPDQ